MCMWFHLLLGGETLVGAVLVGDSDVSSGLTWDVFSKLPWPDTIAYYLAGLVVTNVSGEARVRARMVRRTVVRYCILAYILCIRKLSTRLRKRFPSIHELVKTGIIRADEVREDTLLSLTWLFRQRGLDRRSLTASLSATGGCLSRWPTQDIRGIIHLIPVECGDPEQSSQGRPDHQRPRLQPHDGQAGGLPPLSVRGGRLWSHPGPSRLHAGRPPRRLCLLRRVHHWWTMAHMEKGGSCWPWATMKYITWGRGRGDRSLLSDLHDRQVPFHLRVAPSRWNAVQSLWRGRRGEADTLTLLDWPLSFRILSWMNFLTGKFMGKFVSKDLKRSRFLT